MSISSYDPIPSRAKWTSLNVRALTEVPPETQAHGVAVPQEGDVPPELGLDRSALSALGFDGKVRETLYLPRAGMATLVAVGIGKPAELDASGLRDAAAAFGRATDRYSRISTDLAGLSSVPAEIAGQAVVEGVTLARYQYTPLKEVVSGVDLHDLALVVDVDRLPDVQSGAERGRVTASAESLSRDLASTPPAYLTAAAIAALAESLADECGLTVEVFDEEALRGLGCGGLLGVNAGSVEPPRMVKITYQPQVDDTPAGHLAFVGKGVMYDSGGISLKPSDASHATMKVDMTGAGSILAAMTALKVLQCPTRVTAWLMCTDNMPSGSAIKLGDVLTIHGGKTVEVHNTDAEGRLVMADGLVLATEENVDAIVDVSTLTGSCMVALGRQVAGLFGNDQALIDQVRDSAEAAGERVWHMPLERRYRDQLDSEVADLKNIGGEWGGAITAALFLSEFVGDVPWAHLDIAGPAHSEHSSSWWTKGATGFGTRLLIDLATEFRARDASA